MEGKKIGIIGGSFNPIHNGHINLAKNILEQYKLDKLLLIPVGSHPFRKGDMASAKDRYNMVKLCTDKVDGLEVSDIEIKRTGFSYTVDTLRELKKIYPDATLYLIVGGDILFEITQWKDFKEIFSLCTFVAVFRPGYNFKTFYNQIDKLQNEYGAKIDTVTVPEIDISSTELRNMVRAKKVIGEYVPPEVEEYILKKKLYISDNGDSVS